MTMSLIASIIIPKSFYSNVIVGINKHKCMDHFVDIELEFMTLHLQAFQYCMVYIKCAYVAIAGSS